MLRVSQLKRAYGDFIAAQGVSFSIAKGEIVGLLGHNGAGKTTVMKMLSGFLEPSEGEILFDNRPLSQYLKNLQQKIGYLPESLPVYPELSVVDYLDYAADLKGISGGEKHAEIKRVIKATELTDKLLCPISTLSRGYKQRVGVAQALLGKPSLLILDEPTNGLDPQQTLQMRELIRAIAKDATVILSTHIMQEVDALCDRVLMMRQGKLVIDAKLATLRQSRFIRLRSSAPAAALQTQLASLPEVQAVELLQQDTAPNGLRLEIKIGADCDAVCAMVAKTIFSQGGQLYELRAETRDLETLFREVNSNTKVDPVQEALHHAA
jgi:ABC-2 type transport system ATP-binding protein